MAVPPRAPAGRARGDSSRRRDGSRARRRGGRHEHGHGDRRARPAQTGPPAAPGASAARTMRGPGAHELPLLRRQPLGQNRRGHHRDARDFHVPGVRDYHRATGTLPGYCPRARRSQPACDDSVREVWHPSAAQPAERALCSRRRRDRRVDHGRSRRRQRCRTDAALRAHPQPRARRRACTATTPPCRC